MTTCKPSNPSAEGNQPQNTAGEVTGVDGVVTLTLRNPSGGLEACKLRSVGLKLAEVGSADVNQLFDTAFNVPRDPRSAEYKAGARAALDFRVNSVRIKRTYAPGTAQDDAYHAGIAEGHAIWRKAMAKAADEGAV